MYRVVGPGRPGRFQLCVAESRSLPLRFPKILVVRGHVGPVAAYLGHFCPNSAAFSSGQGVDLMDCTKQMARIRIFQ